MEEVIKIGALIGRGDFDWQAGANSPIVRKVILKGGNWKEKAIPNEIQVVGYGTDKQYDTLECGLFNGLTDCLEYLIMEMLRQNLIPAETVNWLKDPVVNGKHYPSYFKDGYINFNERYSAIKGGITNQGTYQYKNANGAKNWGLIPNDMFPHADNFADEINPAFLTEEMEAVGKEFLKHLAINYEWVNPDDTMEFLEYSPMSCIGQYADGEGILNPPTAQGHNMAEVNETEEYREIDDSYWKQFKKYKKDKLQSFMAYYITPLKNNNMDTAKFIKDNDLKWVQITAGQRNGQFGRVLRGKLMMFISTDRGTLALLDDKMRKEPSVKINQADFEQLEAAGLVANF